MHGGTGVEHHVARRQPHGTLALRVLHEQLAAVVVLRVGEEQGAGNVAAHPLVGHLGAQHGAVHMGAVEVALAAVAVEQWIEDFFGQRGGKEYGVALQRCQHQRAQLLRLGTVLRELLVALVRQRLHPCAAASVYPGGVVTEQAAGGGDFLGRENVFEVQEHGGCSRQGLKGLLRA